MAITTYKHTDTGAPSLTRTVGSLINFFDTILVGTAGTAYGSLPSCGWTKVYSGTNTATYKTPSSMPEMYMLVDDNITANPYYSKVIFARGASTTSLAPDSLKSYFPKQWAIGVVGGGGTPQWQTGYIHKTQTALGTGTGAGWTLINSSDYGFYAMFDTTTTNGTSAHFFYVTPVKSVYNVGAVPSTLAVSMRGWGIINNDQDMGGRGPELYNSGNSFYSFQAVFNAIDRLSGVDLDYARWTLATPAPNGAAISATYNGYENMWGRSEAGYGTYPNELTGDLWVTEGLLTAQLDSMGYLVGRLPGLLVPLHNRPLAHLGTVAGSTPYSGRTFTVLSAEGQVLIDTTGPW